MNQSKVFELEFLSQTGRFTSCLAQLGEKCDLHFRHAFFRLIRPVPFQKTIQTHSQTSSSILSAAPLSPDSPPPKGIVQRYTRRNSVTSAPAAIQTYHTTGVLQHVNIMSDDILQDPPAHRPCRPPFPQVAKNLPRVTHVSKRKSMNIYENTRKSM